jgi:hypothetical protein
MNADAPRAEWVEGPDGKERGPWQKQHIVYLLNLETMDRYSFPTGTIGGGIAVRELVDRTKWMRRLRGDGAYPVVRLSKVHMNTRFGGRDRPFFQIVKWIKLGGDAALAAPVQQGAIEAPSAKVQGITEPTSAEILDDELPDFAKK